MASASDGEKKSIWDDLLSTTSGLSSTDLFDRMGRGVTIGPFGVGGINLDKDDIADIVKAWEKRCSMTLPGSQPALDLEKMKQLIHEMPALAPQRPPAAPEAVVLTLRLVPQGEEARVTWEADVLGSRSSIFRPPYDRVTLPVVIKALDAVQYPSHPQGGPQFTQAERDQLAKLEYWADGRVASDIHVRVGQAIYHALVADPEGQTALSTVRDHATCQGLPPSYLLRFPVEATELAALPWELLWDENGSLLVSGKASCVRYLDLPRALPPPKPPGSKLRFLALSPHAGIPANVREEERAVRDAAWSALKESDLVATEELGPVTPGDLLDRIQDGPPVDVVHFYGHGRYEGGQGALLFDKRGGGKTWVSADRVSKVLSETRLVVLHACQSAMIGPQGLLTGIAPALCAAGAPAVVAMQLAIRPEAATRFAKVLYRQLGRGGSLQEAVSCARLALFVGEEDCVSWYVPTLTIRARDTAPIRLVEPR